MLNEKRKKMDNKIKQLRKGIFELIILGVLQDESHYGYSLIKKIIGDTDYSINEGTIYPILSRLAKEGLIKYDWVESNQGPPRKYYHLTPKGKATFKTLKKEFDNLVTLIKGIQSKPGQIKKNIPEQKIIMIRNDQKNLKKEE
jgi:PadR family transcriptional regulator, regulatory protein PadR